MADDADVGPKTRWELGKMRIRMYRALEMRFFYRDMMLLIVIVHRPLSAVRHAREDGLC